MRRLVWLLLFAACKPSAPAPAPPPPAAAAAPEAAPPAATPASASPGPGSAEREREGASSLTDELEREARQRPTGTPTAETVLDAIEKGGMHIERRRQVLARIVQASFCTTGLLADGGSVAVCEYPDEAAAAKGRELSLEKFKALPNRQIFVNKKTTLTLIRTGGDGGSDVLSEKVKTIFTGL